MNSRANLRYEVLCEIFERLGLPVDQFETKKNFIDKSLCDARNDIAHGRDYYPDPAGFGSTLDDTITMMEDARSLMMHYARARLYRADSTGP